jgi:quinolinate synthase
MDTKVAIEVATNLDRIAENLEAVEQEAMRLHAKLHSAGYELEDCREIAPLVVDIKRLKEEQDVLVLCHHFMVADLIHGIADVVADASELVEAARKTDKKNILVCAIKPLAEAVKIVNPKAKVMLPNTNAGCSIADGISADDVRRLRAEYPDAAAVTYINSSAAVKAESDYVVTSKNAKELMAKLPHKQILFYPDKAVAINVRQELPEKEVILWNGKCVVHEEYTVERISHFKSHHPNTHILFHSECDPAVIPLGHMHGGTHAMMAYVKKHPEVESFFMVTECGIADTMRVEYPKQKFIGTCALCPFMKSINLTNVRDILNGNLSLGEIVELPPGVAQRATRAMDNMYSLVEC